MCIMDFSDVAEVEELSKAEFTHHADGAGVPTCFPPSSVSRNNGKQERGCPGDHLEIESSNPDDTTAICGLRAKLAVLSGSKSVVSLLSC